MSQAAPWPVPCQVLGKLRPASRGRDPREVRTFALAPAQASGPLCRPLVGALGLDERTLSLVSAPQDRTGQGSGRVASTHTGRRVRAGNTPRRGCNPPRAPHPPAGFLPSSGRAA